MFPGIFLRYGSEPTFNVLRRTHRLYEYEFENLGLFAITFLIENAKTNLKAPQSSPKLGQKSSKIVENARPTHSKIDPCSRTCETVGQRNHKIAITVEIKFGVFSVVHRNRTSR